MPTARIADITINLSGRQRKEWDEKKIEELADSIRRLGLLHPPVITRDLVLVVGWTRLEAMKRLGWDQTEVSFTDEVEPQLLHAMELEENVKRYALTWQDECDAIRRYHELRKELADETGGPLWGITDTARELGYSLGTIHERLEVAKALQRGDKRVVEAKVLSTARGLVKRSAARALADEAIVLQTVQEVQAPRSPVLCTSFHDWAADYSGPPFTFINCDFPYGIGADKFNQGAAKSFGGYEDSFEVYAGLCGTLRTNQAKLMGSSCHLLFWFSMKHYQWTREFLENDLHLWLDPYPLVWFKSDNKGTLPDPSRGPRRVYEVAFWCSLGDRPIIAPVSNTAAYPTVRLGEHMSEKSEDMLAHFFRMAVDGSSRVLDPTCGSGSALRAARRLGCTSLLGLEMNPEYAALAERAWNNQLEPELAL